VPNIPMDDPCRLRDLAAWYRAYAERANSPWVREGRQQTAEDLELRASELEQQLALGDERLARHSSPAVAMQGRARL
jgi:hypothetical protein